LPLVFFLENKSEIYNQQRRVWYSSEDSAPWSECWRSTS